MPNMNLESHLEVGIKTTESCGIWKLPLIAIAAIQKIICALRPESSDNSH